jgi:hypothetical protein
MAMFALLHSQGVKADSPKFYDTFIKDHTLTGSQLISSKAELLKYYTTELHYPREYALKILNSMNNSGVEECMKSANGWKQVYQNWDIRFDKVEYVLRFFHIVK